MGFEDRGNPIRHYIAELLAFRRTCDSLDLSIPFILHAGETLDSGGETDANLFDAVLLDAKRIGHGFALPHHPLLMELVREKRIALEICPISNEILHLCPEVKAHPLKVLLANGVPCTVNSDNPAYYRYVHPVSGCASGVESRKRIGEREMTHVEFGRLIGG